MAHFIRLSQLFITLCYTFSGFGPTPLTLTKVCQKMRKYDKVCQNLRNYEKVCQSLKKYEKLCQKLRKCAKTTEQNMFRFSRKYEIRNIPPFAWPYLSYFWHTSVILCQYKQICCCRETFLFTILF